MARWVLTVDRHEEIKRRLADGRSLTNMHNWVASPSVTFTGTTADGLAKDDAKRMLGARFAAVSRGRKFLIQGTIRFDK